MSCKSRERADAEIVQHISVGGKVSDYEPSYLYWQLLKSSRSVSFVNTLMFASTHLISHPAGFNAHIFFVITFEESSN